MATEEIPIFDQEAMDRIADKVLGFDPKKAKGKRLGKEEEQGEKKQPRPSK